MPRRRTALAVALGTLAVLAPRAARAFEGQWRVGAGLGLASFPASGAPPPPLLALHGAYGLSDFFDARLDLTAARHSFAVGQNTLVSGAAGGVAYKLDVMEWIPWAALDVGLYRFDGDPGPEDRLGNFLGASLSLGLDYALSRSVGLGAEGRWHLIGGDEAQGIDSYLTLIGRCEYRWGW